MADDELTTALARLVDQGVLDARQLASVDAAVRPLVSRRPADDDDDDDDDGGRFIDVLAYIGGVLVLAAICVVAAISWDSLGPAGQVALCGGGAVLLLAAAAALSQGTGDRTNRIPAMLAALASGAAGLAAAVAANWVSDDSLDDTSLLSGALGIALVSIPAYLVWRGGPLVLSTYGAGVLLVSYLLSSSNSDSEWAIVTAFTLYGLIVVGVGWLLPERPAAVCLGFASIAGAACAGAFSDDTAAVALLLAIVVIAATFTLYAHTRDSGYAMVGALTALIVPAIATGTLTGSAVVVATSLSIVGFALILTAISSSRRRHGVR